MHEAWLPQTLLILSLFFTLFLEHLDIYIYIERERESKQNLKKKDRQSKSRKKDQKIQGEVQLNEDNRRKAQNIYINKYK